VPDLTNHDRDVSDARRSPSSSDLAGHRKPRLEFRVLGPFEVLADGVGLEVGPPQQRALLVALVLEAGRVVSGDAMVAQLWGDHPPASAAGTVQAYVSQLRRVLEPNRVPRAPASVLVTRCPGYLLDVSPEQVDAARFRAAVGVGQSMLAAGTQCQLSGCC
jgi:DNA-binding SARP family transcriptional activator